MSPGFAAGELSESVQDENTFLPRTEGRHRGFPTHTAELFPGGRKARSYWLTTVTPAARSATERGAAVSGEHLQALAEEGTRSVPTLSGTAGSCLPSSPRVRASALGPGVVPAVAALERPPSTPALSPMHSPCPVSQILPNDLWGHPSGSVTGETGSLP